MRRPSAIDAVVPGRGAGAGPPPPPQPVAMIRSAASSRAEATGNRQRATGTVCSAVGVIEQRINRRPGGVEPLSPGSPDRDHREVAGPECLLKQSLKLLPLVGAIPLGVRSPGDVDVAEQIEIG